jgi:hypothetical protein
MKLISTADEEKTNGAPSQNKPPPGRQVINMDKSKKFDLWDSISFCAFLLMAICMLVIDICHLKAYGNYRFVFVFRDICLFMTTEFLLFRGIYGLRNKITVREPFLRLIAGALLTIGLLSILVIMLQLSNKTESLANDSNVINKLKSFLQSDTISFANKAKLSKVLSKQTFFISGSITEYFDSLGNKLKYVPTNTEIRESDQYRQGCNLLHISILRLRKSIVFWTIVSLLTILISVLWPIHRKKEIKND